MGALHREWQTAKAQSERLWKQAHPREAYPVKFELKLGPSLDDLESTVPGVERKRLFVNPWRTEKPALQKVAMKFNDRQWDRRDEKRQKLRNLADQVLAILAEYEHRLFPYSRALGEASVVVTSEIARLKDKVAEILVDHGLGDESWVERQNARLATAGQPDDQIHRYYQE